MQKKKKKKKIAVREGQTIKNKSPRQSFIACFRIQLTTFEPQVKFI